MEKFADALKQFEMIDRQTSNTDLMQIWEDVAPLLLQISYDKKRGTHNLIGLIRPVVAYTTRYGAEFVTPIKVGAYNATIDDNATAVVHVRMEAAQKSKRADRGTYKMDQRETVQFILAVVEDTWVQELQDTETFYTEVATKALLAHL